MRLFLLVRHGLSLLNVEGVVNGDPARDRGLSPQGVAEAQRLGEQIAHVPIEVAVVSPFPRVLETTRLAVASRGVPIETDPELGDVRIGELEGASLAAYRADPGHSDRTRAFPGGESLDQAARRYADAYRRLLVRAEAVTLVVTHEIPIRYALNSAAGSDRLDAPTHAVANAVPYLFDEDALASAVERIGRLAP